MIVESKESLNYKYFSMRKVILSCAVLLISINVFTQIESTDFGQEGKTEIIEIKKTFDLGFGLGLDYGGIIGAKFTFVPIKHLGIFVSGGYHMVDFGWQIGVIGYVLKKTNLKKIRPYFKVMYGSNRVIIVEGASQYDKNYAGFTPGFGIEFRFGANRTHGLNIDLNYPIESSEFLDDYNDLVSNPMIDISDPSPVAFSIGYHFEF